MEVSVLLDSVILIDHLNGRDVATEYLRRTGEASISVITRAEVLAVSIPTPWERYGCCWTGIGRSPSRPKRRISPYAIARARPERRRGVSTGFASAVRRLRLATRNTWDFPPQQYPFVVVPYSLSRP